MTDPDLTDPQNGPESSPENGPSAPLAAPINITKKRGRVENLTGMGKGRPKGTLNKTTASVKQAIVEAFHKAGGVEYLIKLASKDPRAFVTLLAKILPQDLKVDGEVRHTALFSPEQLRRMADAQEQGTIDITESASISYPDSVEGHSMEQAPAPWPGPADRHFPDEEGGYALNGETELGSHHLRDSDD